MLMKWGHIRQLLTEASGMPVSRDQLPRFLYHATSRKNLEVILRDGLEPQASAVWGYGPSVYVMDDPYGCLDMYYEELMRPGPAVVLKIDCGELPVDIKFFIDEEVGPGGQWGGSHSDRKPVNYWTPDRIPASVLKLTDYV